MSLAMQPSRGCSALQEYREEIRAEKEAMRLIKAVNPKHMFRVNKVEYEMMVLDPDAKPKRKRDGTIELPTAKAITGSQIHGVFNTFLDKTGHSINEAWLSGFVTPLTAAFVSWLLNDYTSRYKGLRNDKGTQWLTNVCHLVVTDWIMLEKYSKYKAGEKAFASDKVREDMEYLMIIREVEAEEIKGDMHSFKHKETAEERDAAIQRRHDNLIARLEAVRRAKNEDEDIYE
jgi:hypothetical protein